MPKWYLVKMWNPRQGTIEYGEFFASSVGEAVRVAHSHSPRNWAQQVYEPCSPVLDAPV